MFTRMTQVRENMLFSLLSKKSSSKWWRILKRWSKIHKKMNTSLLQRIDLEGRFEDLLGLMTWCHMHSR
ncbi:hypothetical protein LINPERPRIM_LOCUS8904 [Linum perenne]